MRRRVLMRRAIPGTAELDNMELARSFCHRSQIVEYQAGCDAKSDGHALRVPRRKYSCLYASDMNDSQLLVTECCTRRSDIPRQ